MLKKIRHFLLFSDIRKYILWYQEISLNYQKKIFLYQKIKFLISENDFLISENRFFDILNCVIFLISIMWISDIKNYILKWYQRIDFLISENNRYFLYQEFEFLISTNHYQKIPQKYENMHNLLCRVRR